MKELPKKPASNHKVQLALNWTASSEDVLDALHNSYKVKKVADDNVVLIQVVSEELELGKKKHQISYGVNCYELYLLTLLDSISMTFRVFFKSGFG